MITHRNDGEIRRTERFHLDGIKGAAQKDAILPGSTTNERQPTNVPLLRLQLEISYPPT